MALARCNFSIQDFSGDVVHGASVEVRDERAIGEPLVSLFSDTDGASPIGNPFTAADGGDAGFYAEGGAYKITATLGGFSRTWHHVANGTAAEHDLPDTFDSTALVPSRSDVSTLETPSSVESILTTGFSDAGDGGGGVLIKHGASDPGLPAGLQVLDASGIYWKRTTPKTIHGHEVGVRADGSDDADAINDCLDFYRTTGQTTLILPAGLVHVESDIILPGSQMTLLGSDYGTELELADTCSVNIHHDSVEVNFSALRRMIISHESGAGTSNKAVSVMNARRCQVTDILFKNWAGSAIKVGEGGAGLTPVAVDILRIRGRGSSNSVNGIWFDNTDDTGDMLISHVFMDPSGGALNGGQGVRMGGAGTGQVDGFTMTDSLFTAFAGGFQGDFPTGSGLGNAMMSNVIFDCGIEMGGSPNANEDTFLIDVSGGTINGLSLNNIVCNAYHTAGDRANFRLNVSGGAVGGFRVGGGSMFYNSYREGVIVSKSGGTFRGFSFVGNTIMDGSRAGVADSDAMVMSGDIDAIMIGGNEIIHGSGDRWAWGLELSGLTGDTPHIGPNEITNVATGTVNLSGTHATAVSGRFWNGKGELEIGGGAVAEDLVNDGSSFVQIDSDNNTTTAEFQVRKDSATPGAGTLIFSVDEAGLVTTLGQIKFPSTQNASADANTLDDYEEGTWTPAGTFSTPGNLSIAYSSQLGMYTKIGRVVTVHCILTTSTFTHTTASGTFRITGLPFAANAFSSQAQRAAGVQWAGITKASYTDLMAKVQFSDTYLEFTASGSGVANSDVAATDMPTGGTVNMRFGATYFT